MFDCFQTNTWRWALVVLVVGTYSVVGLWPEVMAPLGIGLPDGRWFIDLYALLASSEAFALGIDPYLPNPLDWYHVPHWYSDWWFHLNDVGLDRADAHWMGVVTDVTYLVAALVLIRPRDFAEMVTAGLVICSPVMMLGVNRANADLLVFSAFVGAVWLISSRLRSLWLLGGPLIIFMAGLKFYPLAGALALAVAPRSRNEVRASLGLMSILVFLLGLGLYDDVLRVAPLIDTATGLFTFGGAGVFILMGLSSPVALFITFLVGGALVVYWWIRAPVLNAVLPECQVVAFVLGAATLIACFFVSVGYSYRLVFVLLMLPLLGSLRFCAFPTPIRWMVRLGLGGAIFLTWFDGLLCLVSPWVLHSLPPKWATRLFAGAFATIGSVSWLWICAMLGLLMAMVRPVAERLFGRTGETPGRTYPENH